MPKVQCWSLALLLFGIGMLAHLFFSGKKTSMSVSGKHYRTAKQIIKDNDIITIDLSPQIGNVWGDYARTIIIENGVVVNDIENISNSEWRNGLLMEEKLHS